MAVTFAVSADSSMRGTTNFLFTHPASNEQGKGFSYAFTIDPSDKGKVLQCSLEYLVSSGTYADDDMSFWIYDVTNAALIQPAPYLLKNSGIIEKFAIEFQTASNSSSYRLIGHVSTTTATAYTLRFTNFNISAQAKLYGSAVTDWVAYTPTLGAGFGTPTSVSFFYKREGDSLIVQGNFTTGTTAASLGSISLPSGLSIDTTKIAISNTTAAAGQAIGIYSGQATNLHGNIVTATGTSTSLVYISNYIAGTGSILTPNNANTDLSSSTMASFYFKVPILGWSSSQVMSSDADTRVVAVRLNGSSTALGTGSPTISWTAATFDTHAMFNGTTTLTIPVAGKYKINVHGMQNSAAWVATSAIEFYYSKNGGATVVLGRTDSQASFTSTMSVTGVDIVDCKAGDTFVFKCFSNATTAFGGVHLDMMLLQGPAQIAASESVSFSVNTSTTAATTSAPFIYTVKDHDTHNSYSVSTGIFTAPLSGKYHFDCSAYSASSFSLRLRKNSASNVYEGNLATVGTGASTGSFTMQLNAGDTMMVCPSASVTASGGAVVNTFNGFRIGL